MLTVRRSYARAMPIPHATRTIRPTGPLAPGHGSDDCHVPEPHRWATRLGRGSLVSAIAELVSGERLDASTADRGGFDLLCRNAIELDRRAGHDVVVRQPQAVSSDG